MPLPPTWNDSATARCVRPGAHESEGERAFGEEIAGEREDVFRGRGHGNGSGTLRRGAVENVVDEEIETEDAAEGADAAHGAEDHRE